MWREYKKKFEYLLNHTLISANQIVIFFFASAEKGKKLNAQHGKGGFAIFGP